MKSREDFLASAANVHTTIGHIPLPAEGDEEARRNYLVEVCLASGNTGTRAEIRLDIDIAIAAAEKAGEALVQHCLLSPRARTTAMMAYRELMSQSTYAIGFLGGVKGLKPSDFQDIG